MHDLYKKPEPLYLPICEYRTTLSLTTPDKEGKLLRALRWVAAQATCTLAYAIMPGTLIEGLNFPDVSKEGKTLQCPKLKKDVLTSLMRMSCAKA
eukprot:1155504-Pelagomonas_calceolata.AAC.5